MKLLNLFVFVLAVLLVTVYASPIQNTTNQVMPLEESCVRQGGLCMYAEDCSPDYITSISILCPKQAHLGVICCYT